jgi:hypothetical protein
MVRSVENLPLAAVLSDAHAHPAVAVAIGGGHAFLRVDEGAEVGRHQPGVLGLRMAWMISSNKPGSNWLKWPDSSRLITRFRSGSASMNAFGS